MAPVILELALNGSTPRAPRTPAEIAATCLHLASAESSFTTGQLLLPAGGQFTG